MLVRSYQFQLPASPAQLKHVLRAQSRGRRGRLAKLISASIHATMVDEMPIVHRISTSLRRASKRTKESVRPHECRRGLLQAKKARQVIALQGPSGLTGQHEIATIE